MSETKSHVTVITVLWPCMFWGFLGAKWFGSVFVAWSYWWVFLPIVPWLWLFVTKVGL